MQSLVKDDDWTDRLGEDLDPFSKLLHSEMCSDLYYFMNSRRSLEIIVYTKAIYDIFLKVIISGLLLRTDLIAEDSGYGYLNLLSCCALSFAS